MAEANDIIRHIFEVIRDNGYQPSFEELGEKFGYSPQGIVNILSSFEETGMIKLGGRVRAIEFTTLRWLERREIEWNIPDKLSLVLNYIREYISSHGYQPSTTEMSESLDLNRITVMKRIENLQKIGVVENTGGGRALRMIGSKWYPQKLGSAL